jgi:hypothetical protein
MTGLQVRLGPCDDMRAAVFVGVDRPPGSDGAARLTGTLSGPECRRSWTLPTTTDFGDLGPDPSGRSAVLLARAILTEPSYWTPELPNRYRLEARVLQGEHVLGSCELHIGLRRSGVRGRSLWLEGRRWVPRGIAVAAEDFSAPAFHEALAMAVVADPPPALLAAADETGVAVLAVLADREGRPLPVTTAVERLVAWAVHPSVVMAVVPGAAGVATEISRAAGRRRGTMLLGTLLPGAEPPRECPEGIDFIVVDLAAAAVPHAGWREPGPLPRVAWRRDTRVPVAAGSERGALESAALDVCRRQGCDRLQADLAAWGLAGGATRLAWDWAGYVVAASGPR